MNGDPHSLTTYMLQSRHPASLNESKQDKIEEHLLWRYSLTTIRYGHLPLLFYSEPRHARGRCSKCRRVVVPAGADYMDAFLDDEYDSADNDMVRWTQVRAERPRCSLLAMFAAPVAHHRRNLSAPCRSVHHRVSFLLDS